MTKKDSNENVRIRAMMGAPRKPILLKGVILNPWSPSTALLQVELNVTELFDQSAYMNWKEGLEDLLNELDIKYAKRQSGLKGRRVEAVYKTEERSGKKVRVRAVTIQAYPSRFASAIGMIRTAFYGSPNKQGIVGQFSQVIHEERRGMMVQQTRLVPERLYPQLVEAMKEIDKKVEDLQKEIDDYEASEDFQKVKNFILELVPPDRWSKNPERLHTQLHTIHLNPWPLTASSDFIETFTDAETRRQLREAMSNVVTQTVQSMKKDLSEITKNLAVMMSQTFNEFDLKRSQRSVNRLKTMINETNTGDFVSENVDAVEKLINALVEGGEEAIETATTQAALALGIPPSSDPKLTLQEITNKLTEDVDVRVKSLINASLGGD